MVTTTLQCTVVTVLDIATCLAENRAMGQQKSHTPRSSHFEQTQCDPKLQSNGSKGFASSILLVALLLVAVGGGVYYLGTKNSARLDSSFPSQTSSPTQTPSSPEVEKTANWKTYTSTKYSVKYPPNWTLRGQPNVYFSSSDIEYDQIGTGAVLRGGQIAIFESEYPNHTSDNSCSSLYSNTENADTDFAIVSKEDIIIDQIPACLYIASHPGNEDGTFSGITIYKNNKRYAIEAAYSKKDKDSVLQIHQQILSTFKFLN